MTQPVRFLFDECLPQRVVEGQLAESLHLHAPDAVIAHLFSKFSSGVKDTFWIPEIAKDPGWIVVSMDRGKHSRVEERLPLICEKFGVTYVVLSAGLEKRTVYFRAIAIQACWPGLIRAASSPPGTGFVLSMREVGESVSFRLKNKSDPASTIEVPLVQKTLLDPE